MSAREAAAIQAALDLLAESGAAGFVLPMPDGQYLVCGEVGDIFRMAKPLLARLPSTGEKP